VIIRDVIQDDIYSDTPHKSGLDHSHNTTQLIRAFVAPMFSVQKTINK